MKKILFALFVLSLVSACDSNDAEWLAGWKHTNSLSIERAGMATAQANGYIYVMGGVDGANFLRTTEFAKILEDGSVGRWQMGPMLNEERGFFEADIRNGYIYVAGGGNGPYGKYIMRSVERAKILGDGSLGPWEKESNSMIVTRRCSKVMIKDDVIYTFGGFGGVLLDTVEWSRIGVDGSLGEWVMEKPVMTELRYVNGAKIIGESIYVVGGHNMLLGAGIKEVEWAEFKQGGGLSAWKQTRPLLTGRYGLATAKHGKFLYALGGVTGAEYLDSIEVSEVASDGSLSEWRYSSTLSEPLTTFGVVTYKDWIYVIGGTNRHGYRRVVEYASFNQKGDIGFNATHEESIAYQRKKKQRDVLENSLPNEGVVQEVINTQMYSYLYVVRPDGREEWVAGPKASLYTGERVKYSAGVYMSNFYSKELQRNFASVLFVSQLKIVN